MLALCISALMRRWLNAPSMSQEIAQEELDLKAGERAVIVMHGTKDMQYGGYLYHGNPVYVCVHLDTTLAQIRELVRSRLNIPAEEAEKWKIAVCCGQYGSTSTYPAIGWSFFSDTDPH